MCQHKGIVPLLTLQYVCQDYGMVLTLQNVNTIALWHGMSTLGLVYYIILFMGPIFIHPVAEVCTCEVIGFIPLCEPAVVP